MDQGKATFSTYFAALYCRLSKDDEQAGESVSIETQKMMLSEYCRNHSFPIYDIYSDDGFSGLNFERPAFLRMLGDIDRGKVNLVITKDLSRLGRDYIQTGYYTDVYFSRKHVRYIALNDGIDTLGDNNDIVPFKNILNDMYARDLSRKVKAAKRMRASMGYYIGSQTPYGYKVDPLNRNHLVIDPEAAEVVKEIYRLALSGNSPNQICRLLSQQRILKPGAYKALNGDTRFLRYYNSEEDSFRWCWQTVGAILHDRVYTGDMVNHKTEITNYKTRESVRVPKEKHIVVSDCHEPLVSKDDFERIQALISLRHRPQKHSFDNIFRDLVFCAECGHRMMLVMKPQRTGGSKPILRCTNHFINPEQCKHNHSIKYEELHAEVQRRIHALREQLKNGELLEQLQKKNAKERTAVKLLAERRRVEIRMASMRKIIRKLYEDYVCDLLDADTYQFLLNDYTREQKKLVEKRNILEAKSRDTVDTGISVQKLQTVFDNYSSSEPMTALMLNQVIERIEVFHTEKVNGQNTRELSIVFRFIGAYEDIY